MDPRRFLKNNSFLLLLFLLPAASCRHIREVEIISSALGTAEEKTTVINTMQRNMTFINDSAVLLIANAGELIRYNIYSGKETGYFYPDTSYNTLLADEMDQDPALKKTITPIRSYLANTKNSNHIPTASLYTFFVEGEQIYAPYYLLRIYDTTTLYQGKEKKAKIFDRDPLLFFLDKELHSTRTLFINDPDRNCFNFGFAVQQNNIYATNLIPVSESKLPVFSKYTATNKALNFLGESTIAFSPNAYRGRPLTFVNTSFSVHPLTGKMLFCDTRRIAEVETEKVVFDTIFPASDTSEFIMRFDFSPRDINTLHFIIDRMDSAWVHHYMIALYNVAEKRITFRQELGIDEKIKAFALRNDRVVTLELEGENYIFKKYEIVP